MTRRRRLERRLFDLRRRELDAAADGGTIREGSRRLGQLIAETARRVGAVDDRPVDHELLRAEAGPFDEAQGDLLVRTGFDGVEHAGIGNRGRIAVALEQEFLLIDAARDVDRQDQQKVDRLGGARQRDRGRRERDQDQRVSKSSHHGCNPVGDCPRCRCGSAKRNRFRRRCVSIFVAAIDRAMRLDRAGPGR